MNEIEVYVKERNAVFEKYVLNDDEEALKKHCRKWCMLYPEEEIVRKIAVYKAVQHIPAMSDEVKQIAREKCIALGFSPEMR